MKLHRWTIACSILLSMGCDEAADPSAGISPTGTYLEPSEGLGEEGYAVLDEVCENTDSRTYINRYVTPMFRDSAVVGEVVYLVDGSLLWAVDISDPARPIRRSLTRLDGHPISLDVTGEGYLAVGDGVEALTIVDIAEPDAPRIVASLSELPGAPLDVAADGDRIYIAAGGAGLLIADVSDSASPLLLADASVRGFANGVVVADGIAYVAACENVTLVDVGDPVFPEILGTVSIPEGHARELAVEGSRLLVAGGEALFSVDVSDPEHPELIGFYTDRAAVGFYVNAVTLADGVAYIAAGDESFRAVDVRKMTSIGLYVEWDLSAEIDLDGPEQGDPPGTLWNNSGDPIGIALHGDLLLVLGNFRWVGERLLRILDVSGARPEDVGRYVQPNRVRGADRVEDGVLVHYEGGEEILMDRSGETLETFNLTDAVTRMDGEGETRFFLLDSGAVYRTTDLGSPTRVATGGTDVAADDTLAVVAKSYENALDLLPIGTAIEYHDPLPLALEDGFLGFSRLAVANGRVFAYDWALGKLHIIAPDRAGNLAYNGFVYVGQCEAYDVADTFTGEKDDKAGLRRNGEALVMLCPCDDLGLASIRFIDISDPDFPTVDTVFALPDGRFSDFEVTADGVFTVGFDNNRYISTLERFGVDDHHEVSFDGRATGVAVVGDDIFVSDADFGIRRFKYTDEAIAETEPEEESTL